MVLAKVTNEHLIAGLLLRNKKTCGIEIDVYREILLEKFGYCMSPFAVDIRGIIDYIYKLEGNYYMVDTPEVRQLFEEKKGTEIDNLLEDIDIEEVILRKLERLGTIYEHLIPYYFTEEEELYLNNNLIDKLYATYVWSSDPDYPDALEFQLTSFGRERLQAIKENYSNNKELKK